MILGGSSILLVLKIVSVGAILFSSYSYIKGYMNANKNNKIKSQKEVIARQKGSSKTTKKNIEVKKELDKKIAEKAQIDPEKKEEIAEKDKEIAEEIKKYYRRAK